MSAIAVVSLFASACQDSESLFDPDAIEKASRIVFVGCAGGYGLDASRILVRLEPPASATRMDIYRDGALVGSVAGDATEFIDSGLDEGRTYRYACEAIVNFRAHKGTREPQLSTIPSSAPDFNGVASATAVDGRTVRVTWAAAGTGNGIPVAKYKVYANMGTDVDWTKEPRAVVTSALEATLTDLADHVGYAFGVRACAVGEVCDVNTAKATVTLPDAGAPRSQGIRSVFQRDGKVVLEVPWAEADGGLAKRKLYVRQNATGGTNLSDYVSTDYNVTDIKAPLQTIELSGLLEGKPYHFILVDQDPAGQTSSVHAPVSFTTSDLTLPVFTGASGVALGEDEEHTAVVSFTAIAREAVEDPSAGAAKYVVFTTSAAYPQVPPNACASGTETAEMSAASLALGAPATIELNGLVPRRTYSICLKARDSANNTSATSTAHTLTMRDRTPPTFDGIQSLTFDILTGKLLLSWNPSSSQDVSIYRVELWLNSTVPGATTLFEINAFSNATGIAYANTEFPFEQGDIAYAMVNACDDANLIPGSTRNCTSHGSATAKSVLVPDYVPPQGFPGILGEDDLDDSIQGQMVVKWGAPADWSDCRGFKVYAVAPGGALSLLKNCECPLGNCASPSVFDQCTVTGLTPYRKYAFHVRAYDAAGNETQLDPETSQAVKRVRDTTPPVFNSGLKITGTAPDYVVEFSPAVDNQYAEEPGAQITYSVYRKQGTTFADPYAPYNDGTLLSAQTGTTVSAGTVTQLTTYYFAVCASDASGNRLCDGVVRRLDVPDMTPPVIAWFTTDHEPLRKRWSLSWSMSDDHSATGNLRARIFQRSGEEPRRATRDDMLIFDAPGATSVDGLTGPLNAKRFVTYLLLVEDEAGNSAEAQLVVESDNRISVTGIARTNAPANAQKLVVIRGSGFSRSDETGFGAGTTVTIGGAACTGVTVHDPNRISCTAPALAAGSKNVVVSNPEGSYSTLAGGYQVLAASTEICDNPGAWGSEFAKGTGTAGDPFVICTSAHLDRLRLALNESGATRNYRTGGYHFKLGDNIDLQGSGFVPIPEATANPAYFVGSLDGANLAILNFNYSAVENYVGLFRRISGTFKNLELLGFDVSGWSYVGALAGADVLPYIVTLSGIYVNSKVTGVSYTGGLVGDAEAATRVNVSNTRGYVDVTATSSYTGGLFGLWYNGTMSNVWTEGKVAAASSSGGVVGQSASYGAVVSDTGSSATVDSPSGSYVGGVFGAAYATLVTRLKFTGTVNGGAHSGGIIGQINKTTFTDSENWGTINVGYNAGGAVGYSVYSTVSRVRNYGKVIGKSSYGIGGVSGRALCTDIEDSYNGGRIEASGQYYSGGVAGWWEASADASCPSPSTRRFVRNANMGYVNGKNHAGGLAGLINLTGNAADALVQDNYSTGLYRAGDPESYNAGLIGYVSFGPNAVGTAQLTVERSFTSSRFEVLYTRHKGWNGLCSSCTPAPISNGNFWNAEKAGTTVAMSSTGGSDFGEGVTAQTTASMTDSSPGNIYEQAGYDFDTTWKWSAYGNNQGYPMLAHQPDGYSDLPFSGLMSVSKVTGATATLTWHPSPHAIRYEIFDVTSGSPVLVKNVFPPASSVELGGLKPNTDYVFRVRMVDVKGLGDTNTEDLAFRTKSLECYQSVILADSPVVYLPMDETSGTTTINYGSAGGSAAVAGGVTLGRPSPVLGGGSSAVGFDGSTGVLTLPAKPEAEVTGDQTIEFWVKVNVLGVRQNPIDKAYGGTGTMVIETDGSLSYFYGTSGRDASPYTKFKTAAGAIPIGVWKHVAIVRDLAAMTIKHYVNGVEVKSSAAPYDAAAADGDVIQIGNGYAGALNGDMDEFALYDKALSPARIQEHYTSAAACTQ